LASLDLSGMDAAVCASQFMLATDVTNPLCGPDGASAVFGPQKGATPEMVGQLDAGLRRFAEALQEATGRDDSKMPGSGAAGGMGAAFIAVLQAERRSGIELIMD